MASFFITSAPVIIPAAAWWAYAAFAAVFAIGVPVLVARGEWRKARGMDKLVLLGPLFYIAPVALFSTEHFISARAIAALIPGWIPDHLFWVYFVGACFVAAALSLAAKIQMRLAAALLALTFFLFVALMDLPGWLHDPRNRINFSLMLRELAFGAGPLALAASLSYDWRPVLARRAAQVARCLLAGVVLFYSFEQLRYARHVPGVPLGRLTPVWIFGHLYWSYFAALVYAVTGALLLFNRATRAAATWLGAAILIIELAVYLPIGVVYRASIAQGLNYWADTLMFAGTVLLLAGAMPAPAKSASGAEVP